MGFETNLFDSKVIFIVFFSVVAALIAYEPLLFPASMGAMVVAAKAGLGCRYASVSRKTILTLSLVYFTIAAVLGYLLDLLIPLITQLLNYTLLFHLAISLLLVFSGYKTIRSLCCGLDASNKTFLAIAIPCPVCFGATLISCYFVAEVLETSNVFVGMLVGSIIALGIIAFSAKKRANPEKLGTIMLLLGVYYLFAMLLIPAVIQGMNFDFEVSSSFSPISLLLLFFLALGVVKGVKYG